MLPCHYELTGRREAPPDDGLREAIQCQGSKVWIASSLALLAKTAAIPRLTRHALVFAEGPYDFNDSILPAACRRMAEVAKAALAANQQHRRGFASGSGRRRP